MTRFWKDLAERVLWTAAQAVSGILVVELADLPYAWAPFAITGFAMLKNLAAKRVGNPDSASTVSLDA